MPSEFTTLARHLASLVTPLLVYQAIVSVFVIYSLVNAIADGFTFRRPAPVTGDDGRVFPSLSVMIPARNEEATIGACVRSLLTQEYPGTFEVLVLDDRSEDATARVVSEIAAGDARVRLLPGGELLPGWKGKPNALRQLAAEATGEMLLLTDADCTFFPGALASAVRHRERVGADVLSLMPFLECVSFWEHVVIPLQYVLVFATLPIRNVYAKPDPAFAAANGAFILLLAETYDALGGHESARDAMAEDIRFAQHTKRCNRRLVYADGSTTYGVRMYDGLTAIWNGFSKNVFSAMGDLIAVVSIWSLFLLTTQVFPFALLANALATGDRSLALFWIPLAHVAISLGIRTALTVRFRQAWWAIVTQPIGWLIVIAIAWHSAYLALSGRGHVWKGRTYGSVR